MLGCIPQPFLSLIFNQKIIKVLLLVHEDKNRVKNVLSVICTTKQIIST